jgi:hypothetical protein
MKAQFKFDLNNEEERIEFIRCSQSTELTLSLFKMRELIIRNDVITNEEFVEILDEYNINIDNILI